MKYYLGVDGGGTKTTAVVSDENGKIISSGVGKSINYYSNPYESAKDNFRQLINELGVDSFAGAVIGMSALSGRADEEIARKFTDGVIKAEKLIMDSDIAIALDCSEVNTPRAVLICGTGSMAAAINEKNEVLHLGGWGYLLGDEGSGYAIALRGVKSVLKAMDDKCESDLLCEEFKSYFDVYDTGDILERFYTEGVSRDRLAGFCRCVFDASRRGSNLAGAVISAEALEASSLAQRMLSLLPSGSPLYLYGGVFEHNPEYVSLVKAFADPERKIISLLPHPPVIGALSDALVLDGINPDENIYKNLSLYEG